MICQNEIVGHLRTLAKDVDCYPGIGWWNFKYRGYQMVCILNNDSLNTIRVCIPHFDNAMEYTPEYLAAAINETNREVKYVKIVILGNGSISINYDHKYNQGEDVRSIVKHILKSLQFAADYFKNKLAGK